MIKLNTNIGKLRFTAIVEGITYLLLGFTMLLKYKFEMPYPNKIVGMIHGVFFVIYVALVLVVGFQKKWDYVKTFLALLASFIPFGTFIADNMIFKKYS